jgi:hypothetical protein
MDKLLKHAIDDNAVGFINRMKDKMLVHHATQRESISREVAADMAGVEVQESIMHVFVHASGKGIKWRTSDQRTGGEASFSDQKDEKKLRAYFSKVFGSKKEFTLEIREARSSSATKTLTSMTTARGEAPNAHSHTVKVDSDGNGETTGLSGNLGAGGAGGDVVAVKPHKHKITAFKLAPVKKHTHTMKK